MGNPFAGRKLYLDTESFAYAAWQAASGEEEELLAQIALTPQAIWVNGPEGLDRARAVAGEAARAGMLPVFVAYNIPNRDLGNYSAGGAVNREEYLAWIETLAHAIEPAGPAVILEPDALAHIRDMRDVRAQERIGTMREAIGILKARLSIRVYADAGHPRWTPADEMARRLAYAGVEEADGFSLNISNFVATDEVVEYGAKISDEIGGMHFVADTSRNGRGHAQDAEGNLDWCNPEGRTLGVRPTAETSHALADAFLWIKRPGESDGECKGGPQAGEWWQEYALGLAERAA